MRDERVLQLNPEQRVVYDNVMDVVNRPAFFVDGLGGTGKTFLYSCLLSTVRAQGRTTRNFVFCNLFYATILSHIQLFWNCMQHVQLHATCFSCIKQVAKNKISTSVGSLLLWHHLALLHCCWMEAALHTHVSRSLCKASTARPHATSVGTLSWQHFCKWLRSLCGMRLS